MCGVIRTILSSLKIRQWKHYQNIEVLKFKIETIPIYDTDRYQIFKNEKFVKEKWILFISKRPLVVKWKWDCYLLRSEVGISKKDPQASWSSSFKLIVHLSLVIPTCLLQVPDKFNLDLKYSTNVMIIIIIIIIIIIKTTIIIFFKK